MPAKPERRLWFAYTRLFLVPEDLIAIGHALRREFPNLMFRPENDHEWYDLVGGRSFVHGRLVDSGEPPRYVAKPRSEWQTKLTPAPEALFEHYKGYGWIVPPGWAPEWAMLTDGRPYIANVPDLAFMCERSGFLSSRDGWVVARAPTIETESEYVELTDGKFGGGCWPWEEERRRFLRRCKTIVRRHTTVCAVMFDIETNSIVEREDKESPRDGRFGFHALEWARADPRHHIGRDRDRYFIKPVDWTPT